MTSKTDFLHFNATVLFLISVFLFLTVPASAKIDDHIVRTESGFYYTVQKGDTLWDLSKQFSDSPWEWPGLWSNNPQIPNPHLIYPGQKLLIFKKDWEGKEKKEEVREPVIMSVIEPAPAPEASKPNSILCFEIDAIGFIRKEPVAATGNVFKTWHEYVMSSSEEMIYVRPSSDSTPMSVGDKFIIYRTIGPIMDRDTETKIGYQHYLTGKAEITRIEPGYAVARVENSFHEIELNDSLMPFQPRPAEIPLKEGLSGIVAKIIKPEEEIALFGENDIIFFDKGRDDGIEPGQEYAIYQQETVVFNQNTRAKKTLSPEIIGKLIVLHTEAATSTARITFCLKNIEKGQLVGNLAP
ncbi:MAG: LysM peptidoglycan-binding domain-containing protein [Desulfobacterales bacterium]|jgi:LysM repeat protein|nr:LysM peptidoglycan-binding domain-containing protein [Desulfobacterales bacterium]